MDDDLTASHWDDVLLPSQAALPSANINLIFDSMSLENPHRDSSLEDNGSDAESAPTTDGEPAVAEPEPPVTSQNPLLQYGYAAAYSEPEEDQISAMKKLQRDIRKSNLLDQLTSGADEPLAETPVSPVRKLASEALFEDKGSPIRLRPEQTTAPEVSPLKNRFRPARGRRYPAKTVAQHLEQGSLDPLSFSDAPAAAETPAKDKPRQILDEVNVPLYEILAPEQAATSEPKSVDVKEDDAPQGNDLEISVGDPIKVGDITTAHIVYGIRTINKNADGGNFPHTAEPIAVSRRYKDFRWIYHQLQNNHPGKIIPPPPSKQTYIGRFNENFIENRRLSLEKMLSKISKISPLANDPDFVMFLTSTDFAAESKEREQASGSSASAQANSADDESENSSLSSSAIVSGTSAGGFMSSLFSMSVKVPEPDEYFSKKKGYIEDLEYNLRTFHKSLELIAGQRVELVAVLEEVSLTMDELADLEILKTTTNLLAAFAEVQSKLKDNLDRVNLQDQLTLGFTIEEYLRIIGSIKYTFETRSKIYQQYQSFNRDLIKKEETLDKLNSKYKTSVDKISQVSFEVEKLKQKVAHFEASFNSISETIKSEIDKFEMDKIKDFRNSVEIFIEASIESQKEAIELWETFYERQNLTDI